MGKQRAATAVATRCRPVNATRAACSLVFIENEQSQQRNASVESPAITMRIYRTLHASLMPVQQYSENH